MYRVEIDGVEKYIEAKSLAEVTNKVRGMGKRIKIWAPGGLLLIDTKFGDSYTLVS